MDHKELDIWKKAVDFVTEIYTLTKSFPNEEKFGLTSQLRRASVSIAANISEGAARKSDKEFMQFLYICLGSGSEVETLLIISQNLGYVNEEEIKKLTEKIGQLKKMTIGLLKYLRAKHI